MNVVMRNKNVSKIRQRLKNELVRKDVSVGIRGNISTLPPNKVPRYQFTMEMQTSTSRVSSMGPPSGVPRSFKRKLISNSSSAKPESSFSGIRPRVLASDSGAETSHGFLTPKTRPQVIRYISSSSRGGYSGTKSARSTSNSVAEASVILAISEGRGIARGEIGMAAVDLRHPNLVLCQFSDTLLYTHTMTKINYFHPVEIIVPHTFCEGAQPSQLYKLIKDHYPSVNLTTVQRRHFNDAAGRQQIQTLCAPQYSAVCLQVLQKFYALTSAAAVLKYVEYIQCVVFLRQSLKIEYHSSEDTMIIDVGTATQLELVQPLLPSAGVTCCLLGVLGPTYTLGGIRALRANILQPSCNKQFIEARLDSVQELIESDAGLIVDLQNIIRKLSEIDKILFLCMETPNTNIDKFGTAQLNQTLLLKTTMEMVPSLVEALESAESARLRSIQTDFKNPHYHEILERILTIIQKDAHLEKGAMGSMQRCFAVKPDINGLLDVARRTYSELVDDIQKLVEQLGETYDLPLRLNQNVTKGFHVVMPVAPKNRGDFSVNDLPAIFLQAHFNGTSVTMTTEDLVVLDQQAKETLNEIQKMSNIVISELLKELRPFMPSLYKLCEDVAELDVLLALAQASSVGSYIRPEFNSYLEVRNCVHPLLDYNSQKMPVPNDIYASPEYNFTIITGPNMGGKSIYIKQIAIMQIMAQLGCFLPATNAVLRLCDRIFSRIGFNDSVELNASSFVIEMKETQHILKGLTSTSLVIIDELCRGTSSEEGTSLAWAICEELINSNAFTFFTTHFLYLTRLQELYYNVVNRHTSVAEEIVGTDNPQIRLIYKHKIEVGVTKIENYGLSLAAMTNMPEETVNLARELVELIDEPTVSQPKTNEEQSDDEIIYKLKADIAQQIRKHPNSKDKVNELIQNFKTDNPQIIQRIKAQKHLESTSIEATKESSSENCSRVKYSTSNDSASRTEDQNTKKSEYIQDKSTSKDSVAIENYHNNLSDVTTTIENEYNQTNADNNYASVKLSTELLNTVSAQSNLDHIGEDISPEENNMINTPNVAYNKLSQSSKIRSILNEDENDLNPTKIFKKAYRDLNGKENSLLNNMEATEDIAKSFNSDNNGADALTQVVEKYVLTSSSSSVTYSDMSIDEELFQETIMDIQNELDNFNGDENILTPPCDFRDF